MGNFAHERIDRIGTWESTSGISRGYKNSDGKPRVSIMPYTYDIAEGNIAAHSAINITAMISNVTASYKDFDGAAGSISLPTSSINLEVVSSSVKDSKTASGVQYVEIHMLDSVWAETSLVTALGGTSATKFAGAYRRINSVHAYSAGTAGQAIGTIEVRGSGGGTVYNTIQPSENTSLQAAFTVPSGKTAYVTDWTVGIGARGTDTTGYFQLQAMCDGRSRALTSGLYLTDKNVICQDSFANHVPSLPLKYPARCTIKPRVKRIDGTKVLDASITIDMWIENA